MGLSYDPEAHARDLGFTVIERKLRPMRHGEWDNKRRIIVLSQELSRRERRVALAHELQHAIVGDERPSPWGPIVQRQELLATRRALRLLIDRHEYADAERIYGCHLGTLAFELDVTVNAIKAFRRLEEMTWLD